eukprot:310776-Chlamydomonas_euryale.AAC.1
MSLRQFHTFALWPRCAAAPPVLHSMSCRWYPVHIYMGLFYCFVMSSQQSPTVHSFITSVEGRRAAHLSQPCPPACSGHLPGVNLDVRLA